MLRSILPGAYIIRLRSRLQDDMYIDLCSSDSLSAMQDKAADLASLFESHIECWVLDTATLSDHGVFCGYRS